MPSDVHGSYPLLSVCSVDSSRTRLRNAMAAKCIWFYIYIYIYIHRNTYIYIYIYVHVKIGQGRGGVLSEIAQDRQALLAVNLGSVGTSIHKGESCEEGLALLLALEGQL